MKQLLTIIFLFLSSSVFCHDKNDIEYAIVFGGCFDKSVISLKINNKPVFEKYRLGFEKTGNLSLKQTESGIEVYYNGTEQHHSKIKIDYLVNLSVTVNGSSQNFTIDLRKGNILLLDFCNQQATATKKLSIEQRQEAVILM